MIANKYDMCRIGHLEYHLFSSFLDRLNIMSYIGESLKGSPDFQGERAHGGENRSILKLSEMYQRVSSLPANFPIFITIS